MSLRERVLSPRALQFIAFIESLKIDDVTNLKYSGATVPELCAAFPDMNSNSVRWLLYALRQKGLVVRTGDTRIPISRLGKKHEAIYVVASQACE